MRLPIDLIKARRTNMFLIPIGPTGQCMVLPLLDFALNLKISIKCRAKLIGKVRMARQL